ncbi:MAG: ATP-dependent zinc metalloprotease FtsH [Alphaproteobacteria bacterium]|nr:ATP-dependent zinc metalloprotease FtsH [Alphaproteobacteria bacterium]
MNRLWLVLFAFTLLAITGFWFVQQSFEARSTAPTWTDFKTSVSAGEYEEVVIGPEEIRARKKGAEGPLDWVTVNRIEDPSLLPLLDEAKVEYRAARPSPCNEGALLIVIIPLALIAMFWVFIGRQVGQSGRSAAAFGRSNAALAPEEGTGVTFADVAGVDEAVEELQEVVGFLKTPEKFTSLGGRPPKGVLLVGPPGTGKTLLARAVAGEAGVPFFSISGSSFVEMFVGVGAARVRDLFKTALEHAPCIIFVDELDAVGRARGAGGPGSNEEREQTLNQLLVEMDGFDNRRGIIVMAATNRPEILDPALLRAGRFDRQVLVDRPDLIGRTQILKVHAEKLKLADSVDLENVAKLTPGLAGADLANVLNEAALLAARREKEAVEIDDISEAVERVVAGLEKKSRRLSDQEKRMTAYHECGHAICAAASPGADPVHKISIIPRGFALGYTLQVPAEDRFSSTKSELLNRIVTLFGGRAAEALVFGDVTTGAHNDIQRATDIARKMVTEYGMSKRIGAVNYGSRNDNAFGIGFGAGTSTSPHTAEEIEQEVRGILDSCNKRSLEILIRNRPLLEEMSVFLFENEVLEGEVMQTYLSRAEQLESLEDRPTAEWVPDDLLSDDFG